MKVYVRWLWKLLALSAGINIVIELASRKSLLNLGSYIGNSFLIFLLNTLIIFLPFTIMFITRRKAFACILITFLWIFMGIVNGILLIFRTTPFTAADLRLVKYAISLATVYFTWMQIILMVSGGVLALILLVGVWKKAPVSQEKTRLSHGVAIILLSTALVLGITTGAMRYGLVAVHFGNIGQGFRSYGFPYCFSNSVFNTGIAKPEGYGSETLETIQSEELVPENTYAITENTKPNVIFIQLESFFDPSLWKNNPVDYDPIPFFHQLQKNYPGGYLSVPSVGAGTANTEFENITGMNLDFFGPGEYPYKTCLLYTSDAADEL